jgi:hypothetical protein
VSIRVFDSVCATVAGKGELQRRGTSEGLAPAAGSLFQGPQPIFSNMGYTLGSILPDQGTPRLKYLPSYSSVDTMPYASITCHENED